MAGGREQLLTLRLVNELQELLNEFPLEELLDDSGCAAKCLVELAEGVFSVLMHLLRDVAMRRGGGSREEVGEQGASSTAWNDVESSILKLPPLPCPGWPPLSLPFLCSPSAAPSHLFLHLHRLSLALFIFLSSASPFPLDRASLHHPAISPSLLPLICISTASTSPSFPMHEPFIALPLHLITYLDLPAPFPPPSQPQCFPSHPSLIADVSRFCPQPLCRSSLLCLSIPPSTGLSPSLPPLPPFLLTSLISHLSALMTPAVPVKTQSSEWQLRRGSNCAPLKRLQDRNGSPRVGGGSWRCSEG